MKLIPANAAAARARAAIAYSGEELRTIAAMTGIKEGTLRTVTSRTRPSGGTLDRLHAIADACQVPRSFMEEGFAPDPPRSATDQLEDLHRQVEELRSMVMDLVAGEAK